MGGHVLGEPDIAANDCIVANGDPAEDGGASVYRDVIFKDRVARNAFGKAAVRILGE